MPDDTTPLADRHPALCDLIVALLRQLNTWRELAHESIHQLHDSETKYRQLRHHYRHAIDDNRRLRLEQRQRREAA